MKMNCIILLSWRRKVVTPVGGSTKMTVKMVTGYANIQMDQSAIISTRMVCKTVTEFNYSLMHPYIEASSNITERTVMDS